MELAKETTEFLAVHSLEAFLGVFVLALLWLVALSDWFWHRFGGLDLWINDIQRGRLVECYKATTVFLASFVLVAFGDGLSGYIACGLLLMLFFGSHHGNQVLWMLGIIGAKSPGIGSLRYHRRVAIASMVFFAFSFGLDKWVAVAHAKEPAHQVQPTKKKVAPVYEPGKRDNARRLA